MDHALQSKCNGTFSTSLLIRSISPGPLHRKHRSESYPSVPSIWIEHRDTLQMSLKDEKESSEKYFLKTA